MSVLSRQQLGLWRNRSLEGPGALREGPRSTETPLWLGDPSLAPLYSEIYIYIYLRVEREGGGEKGERETKRERGRQRDKESERDETERETET